MKLIVNFKSQADLTCAQRVQAVVQELPYVESVEIHAWDPDPAKDLKWRTVTVDRILSMIGDPKVEQHQRDALERAIVEKSSIRIIKVIRELTGLGLSESKAITDRLLN